jgi:hypothetical protein
MTRRNEKIVESVAVNAVPIPAVNFAVIAVTLD